MAVSESAEPPNHEADAPTRRRGPRPLLLHMMLAMWRSSVSLAASPTWRSDWPGSNPATAHKAVERSFPEEVCRELQARDAALISGIAAYRRHPYRRVLQDPPVVWQEGGSRLLDFGGTGPRMLVVPSLINRATVLDLRPGRSLMRFLADSGAARPLLLDWGWPGELERGFSVTDYVAGRLERAIMALPDRAILAGYCMGGLLALAAALRRPDRIRALALLATPWDFHAPAEAAPRAIAAGRMLPALEPVMALHGALPVDGIQSLLISVDPFGVAAKYRAFARLDPDSERATDFVALEDWLNDGVPLAAPVARECLSGWYGANAPARLAWRVAGGTVDPGALRMPCFIAIPARDRIVPPENAAMLGVHIGHAQIHRPTAGHVGMVAGASAEAVLWRPFATWLRGLPAA